MAVFDNHKRCAHCRDKGVGDDPCVKKQECKICQDLTPAQLKQLSTPTYQSRKERELKKSSSDSPTSATPTLVDPADVSVLKSLHVDKGKGKSSERMQQAVDELEYLFTFNGSISQAMARTMQYLSEGVFISVANFTLARTDSYLEYLHAEVKQDTLAALRTAPIHIHSLFLDQLLMKAEEEVARSEERRSSSLSHRKPRSFSSLCFQ